MQLASYDFSKSGACHEVVESFVNQQKYVSIWRHDADDHSVFTYSESDLPDGHYSPRETKHFTTEKPNSVGGRIVGTIESIDYGTLVVDEVYDNLEEPLAKLIALTKELDHAS